MNAARWARVRSILERIIDANGVALESQLARECGNDAELRSEIESLLRFEARGASLEPPAFPEVATTIADPDLPRFEGRIGPHTIEKTTATDGMGPLD